jgi:hypothetical protein
VGKPWMKCGSECMSLINGLTTTTDSLRFDSR